MEKLDFSELQDKRWPQRGGIRPSLASSNPRSWERPLGNGLFCRYQLHVYFFTSDFIYLRCVSFFLYILAKFLLILFISSKNQLSFVDLFFLASGSFISSLVFVMSFPLITLGFVCSFSSDLRYKLDCLFEVFFSKCRCSLWKITLNVQYQELDRRWSNRAVFSICQGGSLLVIRGKAVGGISDVTLRVTPSAGSV